ncbi:hypothetical protein [uncultured Mitsuokella sp.]|uniref:virion core protein, T7 gp14 family n=1 Tax=uncultured Mitsuokella sp. TaxID=453120 RepID=UPI0025968E48|nr:hypothetical protein [uncultured Mitsuokella sp.]
MCSVIAGLTALGGALQYRSQQQAAKQQEAAYRAQAEAAEQNARIEGKKQEQIADNYAAQADKLRSRRRLIEGSQRAQTGAAGLNFGGSAMDILSSSNDAYLQDQMTLLSNQRNDNYNSRVAESNYEAQAANDRTAASNIKRAAKWQGLSTILGTAASVYGVAQPWKDTGATASSSTGGAYQYYNEKTTADTWAKANRQFPTVSGTGYLTYGKPVLSYGKNTGWDIRPDYYSRNGKVNFPFRF